MLGTGYAILLLPILSVIYDPKLLVPMINLHCLFLGGAILVKSWRQADYGRVWRLFIGGAIGTPIGVYALRVIDPVTLKIIIGSAISLFALVLMLGFGWKLKRERPALLPVGIASGFMNGLIGMGGPPVVLFLTNQEVEKDALRASITLFFFAQNIISVPIYWWNGLMTPEAMRLSLHLFPALVIGTGLGIYLHPRVNEATFRRIVLWIVMAAGVVAVGSGLRLW